MGLLYSPQFVLLLAFGAMFYKGAEMEGSPRPVLWGGLSALVFLGTWRCLGYGLLGNLFGQIVLIGLITLGRVLFDRK